MKERAIAYIDGYNLYYGLLKGTSCKWLDLYVFARSLIRPNLDIVTVKYFTAPIKTCPHDFAADARVLTRPRLFADPQTVTILNVQGASAG